MNIPFNLFDEYDFETLLPEVTSAKERLQRDLLLDIIRADFSARSGSGGDTAIAQYNVERVEALARALQALKEE